MFLITSKILESSKHIPQESVQPWLIKGHILWHSPENQFKVKLHLMVYEPQWGCVYIWPIIWYDICAERVLCVCNVIHEVNHTICHIILQQQFQIWHSTLCFLMWGERRAPAGSGQGSRLELLAVSLFTAAGWGFYCLKERRNVHVLVFCRT